MARVLVIEDESDLQEILRYNLGQAGHDVRVAGTGTEGLRLAKADLPDIVLLDLMLPDMSGTEICKTLRGNPATQHIHIMMLTAKGEEIDRVVGFELGADDYVVNPFSVRELLLRIQSVLRRRPIGEAPELQVRFGLMRIHRTAHRAWIAEQEIELTALEFKLLITLFDRQNRVQTRDTLLADVWGIEADVTTRTVDTHVKRLREKLGQAGQYIETVRGVGYRFSETPDDIAP